MKDKKDKDEVLKEELTDNLTVSDNSDTTEDSWVNPDFVYNPEDYEESDSDDGEENNTLDKDDVDSTDSAEENNKLKKLNSILILVIAFLCLAIVAGSIYSYTLINKTHEIGSSKDNRTYVLTYEDIKISLEDFKYFKGLASTEAPSKDDVLKSIKEALAFYRKAKENNLKLSASDTDAIKQNVLDAKCTILKNLGYLPDITDERYEFLMQFDSYMYKLATMYVDNHVVDETDFDKAKTEFMDGYKGIQFAKYIKSNTEDEANATLERIKNGTAFDTLIEIDPTGLRDLIPIVETYFHTSTITNLEAMKVGDVTDVMQLTNVPGYFILCITEPITYEEADANYRSSGGPSFREDYIWGKVSEIFGNNIKVWCDELDLNLNQNVYDSIED